MGSEKKGLKEYELKKEKGGSIFVYTNRIPESVNTTNEMFGRERLGEYLNKNRDDSMEEIISEVSDDIESFSIGKDQSDDITMLGFKFLG